MINDHPHIRLNILTNEWVLVSPHRAKRPWQGQVEEPFHPADIRYDPDCYLCPGNERAGGAVNPNYTSTFVFDNDFAALYPNVPEEKLDVDGLLIARSERGICRVICFSPNHSLTLARMRVEEIEKVVERWIEQFLELGGFDFINSVQIFENRGAMMGASNPHPHGQIWASETVPNELGKEILSFRRRLEKTGGCILCEYLNLELREKSRLVCENDSFAAFVPFWAVYPFEIIVIPKNHHSGLDGLNEKEKTNLADILNQITIRYDNLFQTSFPYSMGFHQRPTNGADNSFFHFHAHFYPPLLRSATVRKFLVGFELLAMPQRDITPETAAEKLRALSGIHYLD